MGLREHFLSIAVRCDVALTQGERSAGRSRCADVLRGGPLQIGTMA
ncbi:hypothetical protein BLL52_2887 [Rhodoferax antarcticus ANT.BR]|uniref:Uncharacterized protein n=1 Tax=Rhodoferax antarcticus ANT.BR TaxID=1111071 RepID=A0A1Q8YF16_9BURK|nr:hypothetical protein BLL52_2887 [Rhodoferax antarcticus ANT.BR]